MSSPAEPANETECAGGPERRHQTLVLGPDRDLDHQPDQHRDSGDDVWSSCHVVRRIHGDSDHGHLLSVYQVSGCLPDHDTGQADPYPQRVVRSDQRRARIADRTRLSLRQTRRQRTTQARPLRTHVGRCVPSYLGQDGTTYSRCSLVIQNPASRGGLTVHQSVGASLPS